MTGPRPVRKGSPAQRCARRYIPARPPAAPAPATGDPGGGEPEVGFAIGPAASEAILKLEPIEQVAIVAEISRARHPSIAEELRRAEAAVCWNAALERARAGEALEYTLGWPSDWRRRERDRRIRQLAVCGLSSARIARELRLGERCPFVSAVVAIVRLNENRLLCERQIRRILTRGGHR